jgi:hypothetical protein
MQPVQVPAPPGGLESGTNYFITAAQSGGTILGLNVVIDITEVIVGNVGFGFQLNCFSKSGSRTVWQQFVLAILDDANVSWTVENWQKDGVTQSIDASGAVCALPVANTLPAGYKLQITLGNEPNGSISAAVFSVTDNHGHQTMVSKNLVDLKGQTASKQVTPVTEADLAPIVGCQLSLVGPTTSSLGPMESGRTVLYAGEGTFTYSASVPLQPQSKLPVDTASTEGTGEGANSDYSPMVAGSAETLTQKFFWMPLAESVVCVSQPYGQQYEVNQFSGYGSSDWGVTNLSVTVQDFTPVPIGSPLCAYPWRWGRSQQVVFLDAAAHVNELSQKGAGRWSWANLSAIAGAPPAAPQSRLSGYPWLAGKCKQVVYLDTGGQVHELVVGGTASKWTHTNLSVASSAPTRASGAELCGYDWEAGSSKQVVYFDNCGSVNELFRRLGQDWRYANLSEASKAPAAAHDSKLSGYQWTAGNTKQVVYLDSAGHVHELYCAVGGNWLHGPLSEMTGAQPAALGSAIVGYEWQLENCKQVVYLDAAGNVWELSLVHGSKWIHANLTSLTSAPPAVSGSPLTAFQWIYGKAKQVMYLDAAGHVHQLQIVAGGGWKHIDISDQNATVASKGSALSGYEWLGP